MAEELRTVQKGYKIWKNPASREDSIHYMGEVSPPNGQPFLTGSDLRALGYVPGRYTVLAPPDALHSGLFSKWQTVEVSE